MSAIKTEETLQNVNSSAKDIIEEPSQDEKETKHTFRRKVWDNLIKNKIACFPSPYGRIPNFKGADQAARQLLHLTEFASAKSVEVNPDKPLEPSRIIVLENEKDLYVPVPRLRESLLKRLHRGEDDLPIKRIVSRWGIENTGQVIGINDKVHIDLFVLGSVAVSKEGYRIGKGKGYADLEFALLKEMKAIDDNTLIVTTVHDSQVFDELPKDLFKKHDVPIDYILTPTQIVKVENKLPRPDGIFWELLSQRRLNEIDILQKLKQKHESEGKDVILKEKDTDIESSVPRRFHRYKRFVKKRPKTKSTTSENGDNNASIEESKKDAKSQNRRRYFRRSDSVKAQDVKNKENLASENSENIPPTKPKKKNRKLHIDFSLLVSNIERNVRVRDLKNALREKGIKPNNITWKGYRGFCYLHYANKNNKSKVEDEENEPIPKEPVAIDNVIEILQGLKFSPDSTNNLNVKVMEPITRIETTDVTAV